MVYWYLRGKYLDGFHAEDIRQGQQVVVLGSVALDDRLGRLCDEVGPENILCIMDRDESVWGTTCRGIPVVKPASGVACVVMTHEYDWKGIAQEANKLGYHDVYCFMSKARKEIIEQYIMQALPLYEQSRIPENPEFKYVHWIPACAHFPAVVEAIEYGMQPEEHFFIIYEGRGQGNSVVVLDKCREWMERYHNIYLLHGWYPIEPVYQYGLEYEEDRLDKLLQKAQKILFHSEIPILGLEDYLCGKADLIEQKGILLLISDVIKKDRVRYVEKVLGRVRGLVTPKNTKAFEDYIGERYPNLHPGMLLYTKIDYLRLPKPVEHTVGAEKNILICHSSGWSNCATETLEKLAGIEGSFNVYALLSYGSVDSAREIEAQGAALFGDRFIPVKRFMEYDEYVEFLSRMDVAVFGMSAFAGRATMELLFLAGVKVYLKPESRAHLRISEMGYRVMDYHSVWGQTLDEILDNPNREWNRNVATRLLDPDEKVRQWRELYEYDIGNV